ncbi:uncharacterized protein TNCV_3802701 [Trichonephila clavipes]|nr:uncharacterized protein TNCV_3802701 [Trichonephila clavipes]
MASSSAVAEDRLNMLNLLRLEVLMLAWCINLESGVRSQTFRSIFAVTLSLVTVCLSNSWEAQLAVPNDPSNDTHTITPAVGTVCRCKAKAGLRRSLRGLHTRTRLSSLLRLNLDSSLKTTTWFHSTAVQFPRVRHHSKWRRRWVDVKGSTHNGHHDSKCPYDVAVFSTTGLSRAF